MEYKFGATGGQGGGFMGDLTDEIKRLTFEINKLKASKNKEVSMGREETKNPIMRTMIFINDSVLTDDQIIGQDENGDMWVLDYDFPNTRTRYLNKWRRLPEAE
jgi:hypothetical protein